MKLPGLGLAVLFSMPFACKDTSGAKPYDTYQNCFDDQTFVVKLMVEDAVVVCCLDHPIGGVKPVCKDTAPDCINFLTANLLQTSASTTQVMEACAMYIDMRML
jgi:hypothetical protein